MSEEIQKRLDELSAEFLEQLDECNKQLNEEIRLLSVKIGEQGIKAGCMRVGPGMYNVWWSPDVDDVTHEYPGLSAWLPDHAWFSEPEEDKLSDTVFGRMLPKEPPAHDPKYPHTCKYCGKQSYNGLNRVEHRFKADEILCGRR